MIILTDEMIEERLREAVSLQKVVTCPPRWPTESHLRISADCLKHERPIGDVADVLAWLDWLDDEDAALVQARLEGARWKMICWRFGISRPTAYRRWRHALGLIAWRLNGNALPTGCSRRRFMQLVDRRR